MVSFHIHWKHVHLLRRYITTHLSSYFNSADRARLSTNSSFKFFNTNHAPATLVTIIRSENGLVDEWMYRDTRMSLRQSQPLICISSIYFQILKCFYFCKRENLWRRMDGTAFRGEKITSPLLSPVFPQLLPISWCVTWPTGPSIALAVPSSPRTTLTLSCARTSSTRSPPSTASTKSPPLSGMMRSSTPDSTASRTCEPPHCGLSAQSLSIQIYVYNHNDKRLEMILIIDAVFCLFFTMIACALNSE